jgi:hypothetical protein
MVRYCAGKNRIILDFSWFWYAHSVIDLNEADSGTRKFILTQLPEPAGRTDFRTISEITRERGRRVFKKKAQAKPKLQLESKGKQCSKLCAAVRESHFRASLKVGDGSRLQSIGLKL